MSETLESFLEKQKAEKVNDFTYNFDYKGVPCAGIITRGFANWLTIRPLNSTDKIASVAGEAEYLNFELPETNQSK